VYELCALGGGDSVLVNTASYLQQSTWYRYDPPTSGRGTLAPTTLTTPLGVDLGAVEVVTESAKSKDGTLVPLTIIRPKGTRLAGSNPTLLTGYGGFGVSQSPGFDLGSKVWLEQGGVVAIAGLRGGGEFGAAWHEAGRLLHKQNVFDDFIACAQHLIRTRVTNPERLAIQGGSNGGLLMGAAMTQRPELFRAVVSHVGIYDMLRVELSPNGAFNVPEYGSVADPAQFRALYAYSPYHRVKDGVAYPPVLFLTGANDPRVDPMQSRKMTARLQAASAGKNLVLLRTSASSGHGIGTSLDERIEQEVDVWAFLFKVLGVPYRPLPTK
jgi:prolyl oligopeptidase